MSYRRVGQVIFSLHLGVGHSVLLQLEWVGHVFSNHPISKCSGPPPPPPPPCTFLPVPNVQVEDSYLIINMYSR